MNTTTRWHTLFSWITARPGLAVPLCLALVVVAGSGLAGLKKDTSMTAFIPPGHPALEAREEARATFGLADPIALALTRDDGGSIFEPAALIRIRELTAAVEALENVRVDRISSLASESSILGDAGEIRVDPYIEPAGAVTPEAARAARQRWLRMLPHQGTLVSHDESAALILAEVVDPDQALATYQALLDLETLDVAPPFSVHVAGAAAVSAYLSAYIDRDARRLQPLVVLVMLAFLYLAFRRLPGMLAPMLVILGASGATLGIMAWLNIPYFAITNALPVVVLAISIADSVHILSRYYQLTAAGTLRSRRERVVQALCDMARPVTLTTLTTMAGFIGIGVTSIMPPVTYFAWFAALGVALAWLLSLTLLPNVMLLVDPGMSPAFGRRKDQLPAGAVRLARVGLWSVKHRPLVLLLLALTLLGGTGLALDIRFDRSQVENFGAGEPIRRADALMNERFAGTGTLNVIVDAGEPGGLLRPDVLDRVEQLQNFFSSLPHVGKTVSIVDYLKLLDRAIKEDAGPGQLPTGENAVAQYLLVYEASGDPTDFDEEIDPTYQRLLLRGAVSSPLYSESGESVEKLERYIEQHFSGTDLQVAIAGDVNISYQWMSSLKKSHFAGVGLSLLLIFLSASILFRSAATGLLALLPVALTVLCLYACMGFAGVYLEPATAMFAAIALGVGVDFAIHLVDRLRGQDRSADEHAYFRAYAATARACLFNAAALGVGFAVLTVSELPTLIRFGALVALAAAVSYLAALLLVPALLPQPSKVVPHARRRGATALAVLAAGLLALAAQRAAAQSTADEIAAAIEGRPEGTYSQVLLDITLIHPRGGVRERQAVIHTWRTAQFKKTRITYTQPANVRDTSFLSHDYVGGAGIDERWLYTPAIGKHRRIPPSGRGKSFLGTDFSYEDIQSGLKFSLADYRFELPPAADAGSTGVRLGGVPATPAIARELRNGGFVATVDPGNWMPREITFRDPRGNPLKTIKVPVLERIDGIWSAREITAQNLKSGHQTAFKLRDIRFPTALPPELFDPRTLNRGLPGEVAP